MALLTGAVACSTPPLRDGVSVQHLGVPGRFNATPWMAASGEFVALAWGGMAPGGKSDVFVAVSRDGGATFGVPVQVNERAGEARLGGEMPPRVEVVADAGGRPPQVIVLWTARRLSGQTEIRLARSTDGGRTFGMERSLQSPMAQGDRGWPALALNDRGTAHVVWLDHRGLAATADTHRRPTGASEMVPDDGVALAERSRLYYASSTLQAMQPERALANGVCYCCKTALAAGSDGFVAVAWRQVYPGNFRDIAFLVSENHGRTFGPPARISEDGWRLDGCPDDGPAIAVDAANVSHVVWPTVIEGTAPEGALFYASTPDGRVFTPRQRIPTLGSLKPAHPQVAVAGAGRLIVAWDEAHAGTRAVAIRELHTEASRGVTFGPPRVLNAGAPGSYPVLATTSQEVLVAWTSGGADAATIAVARIAAGQGPPPR